MLGNVEDEMKECALHPITCRGDPEDLHQMTITLNQDPESLERPNFLFEDSTLTPLQSAIQSGHINCIEFLISKGANYHRNYGWCGDAMDTAILFNKINIIRMLMDKYSVYPTSDNNNYLNCNPSALYLYNAAAHGSPQAIQLLIDNGAKTEYLECIQNMPTPAVMAIRHEQPDNLKILLINGAQTKFYEDGKHLSTLDCDMLSLPIALALSMGDSLNKKIKILKILFYFGVKILEKISTGDDILTVLENTERRQKVEDYYFNHERYRIIQSSNCSMGNRFKLAAEVRLISSIPMSLKAQCRLVLLKINHCESILSRLPLELQHYVQFKVI